MGQTINKWARTSAPEVRGEVQPSIRVLLIEDDPISAQLTSLYLQSDVPSAAITIAGTLKEALAQAEREPFDLAIVDLNLPDSSGLATIRAFARSCSTAFIVITGDEEPTLRERAIGEGAFEFLPKAQLNHESLQRLVRLGSLYARNLRSLRESETQYRTLVELSSDTHWEQDQQYRFVSFSSKDPDGRGPQMAMLGKRRWDRAHLNMTPADWEAHRALLEARLPFHDLELAWLNEAGEEVWISTSGQPLFADDGTFKGYRGVGHDISAAKRAERALQESEERFRRLTALSSDWYWEQDSEFRLTFMSTTLQEKTGLPAHPYLGRHRWEQPALNLSDEDWARHRAQLERHEPFRDFEMQRPLPDGGSRWLSVSGEPLFDKSGRFCGYRGIGRDITERKREERLLRLELSIIRYLADAEVQDQDAVRFVLRSLCESEGWACARLFRLDAAGAAMRFEAGWNSPSAKLDNFMEASKGLQVAHGQGLIGSVWRSLKPEWVADASADERMSSLPLWRAADLRSAFAFPVLSGGSAIGVVSISSPLIHRPDARLLQHAEIVGSQLGHFLQRRQAERRQSIYLRYQEKIARLGQSALGMREPSELIVDAAQAVLEGLGADAVAYLEPATGEGAVIAREVLGLAEEPARSVVQYGATDPIAAVLRGTATMIEKASGAPLPFDWANAASSAALVPVAAERGTRGALCALSGEAGAFGTDEIRFIEAAASVLSSGLQRVESEARLAYLAQFDALTGLPNRALLSDRFAQMIVQARRHAKQLGVLFIDLDDFKLVNDALGHAAGDDVLRQVAERLQRCVRPGDTIARISGDEFAAVLADLARADDAAIVAQKILDALAVPIDIRGKEVFAAASIGIATFPSDGGEAESLLGAADAAMYRAKESHRNSYQFFTAEINERTRARAQLSSELRRALERDEFRLFYQPKIDLRNGGTCGVEALLRWQHPERGVIPPVQFIPVLEETGLIVPAGEWVVRRACEDLKSWTAGGFRPIPVAVNVSARQFRQPDFDVRIRSMIDAAGVDPALVELEITESQLMHDPEHAIRMLGNLRAAGMSIAIDDFGTGYSSLAYLTRFPLAALKIDRSFVTNVLSDRAAAAIVRTVVDMAKQLGLKVVAEGVETTAQAAFLRQLGCEQAQGYLFAKPMPADELAAFLGNQSPR
jgi:diguanylate cyclase (GGDEF)-like protein/PAS domain S-box-containing protein